MKTKKQTDTIQKILAMNFRRELPPETISRSLRESIMDEVRMIGPLVPARNGRNGVYVDRVFWRVAWASIAVALVVALLGYAEYARFQSSLVEIAVEDPLDLTSLVMNY